MPVEHTPDSAPLLPAHKMRVLNRLEVEKRLSLQPVYVIVEIQHDVIVIFHQFLCEFDFRLNFRLFQFHAFDELVNFPLIESDRVRKFRA